MKIEHAASTPEQAKGYATGPFSNEHLKELRAQGLTIPSIAKVLGAAPRSTGVSGRTSRLLSTER